MIIEWLNSLCPKLQNLLQIKLQKEYSYNFTFASQAVQNSIQMMESQRTEHFEPLNPPTLAEVIATVTVEGNDESTLVKLINIWDKSNKHRDLLRDYNSLGIGFAYDLGRNILYTTVRLGD